MSPFEPAGESARWRIIYEQLAALDVGQTLTYEVMADALELDATSDRHVMQVAMRRAARELQVVNKHAVEAVKNVGYRVVEAEEHLRLAKGQQRKSSLALKRGDDLVKNVDLSDVDPEIRHAFQVVASAFAMQQDFNRRTDIRQKKLEESLAAMKVKSTKTEDEVAEILERLKQLEQDRKNGQA
jgi:hypothetical protein